LIINVRPRADRKSSRVCGFPKDNHYLRPAVIQVASTWRLLIAVFACLQKNDGSGYAALFRPSSNALNLTALLQIMPSQNQL